MLMRLVAGVMLVVALGWSLGARRAEASKVAPPAEAPDGSAAKPESAEKESGDEDAAARLNPVTFRGFTFPGDLSIWTAVVFVVVLLILGKFAWGPIAQGLQKREQQIADQIAQAEQSNQDARQLLADYQQKLAASHDEVRGIVEQGRRDAEQIGRELVEKAKAEADAERQRALHDIESATSASLKELADRSASLAVELAGKIVRTRLDPKDHARLIQEAVAGFTGSGTNRKL
jgi:F-type H+-transporting ATPase subunit b